MDMMISNSAITPIFFQNSKNGMTILSLYHHNSGNGWAYTTGTVQTWFGPPTPCYNDLTQCGMLYNTWGRMSFTRIGTQMLVMSKPLTGGAPKSWSWAVQGDDIDIIGFATRFSGAGHIYWDNIKCIQ
jgi:hypothetical protein